MGNLRRFYYNNKTKIWRIILITAIILGIIYGINYQLKFERENAVKQPIINEPIESTTNNDVNDDILKSEESAINGNNISGNKLNNDVELLKNFFELCNNKEYEKAYELVSNECKENLYGNYDVFKKAYCDNIFNTVKTYSIENWSGSTYKVRFFEDILATGQTSENMTVQDYITIVEDDSGEDKLNINNYISRTKLDKTNTQNDITINVFNKDTYMDYEIYNIQVINNTSKNICLDSGEEVSTIYIQDDKGIKCEAASSELIFSTLIIEPGETKEYSIKYTNSYVTDRNISNMVFEKLILDYNEYIKDTQIYTDIIKFNIEL